MYGVLSTVDSRVQSQLSGHWPVDLVHPVPSSSPTDTFPFVPVFFFPQDFNCRESFTTPCKTGEKRALRGKTCFCCFKPISFLQVPAWMYGNHYGGGAGLIREAGLWWGNRAQGLMKRVTSAPLTESPPMGPPFRSDMPRRLSPQTLQTQTAGVCIGV